VDAEVIDRAIQRDQSLATLFGPQDYCACDDCTSLLSPAAYLCDLLHWLGERPAKDTAKTALDILLDPDRRPDLGHLLLNCPNTDVPLPYIDLVNELLEDAIPRAPGDPPPVWKQTPATSTAAELRAEPVFVNTDAYKKLRDDAKYPHTLPYDWALDELRTYLGQSGVPLWQLRDALLPFKEDSTLALDAALNVAAEWFEICASEVPLIVDADPTGANFGKTWNTADATTDLVQLAPREDAPDDLGRPFFLQAAGISYAQLLELLDAKWVVGDPPAIKIDGIDDTCDLSKQTLSPAPIDPGILDRIHRFLRLWRHDSWTMWELNLLLESPSVGPGTLDKDALVKLYEFRRFND
jgi:hypothetical protein